MSENGLRFFKTEFPDKWIYLSKKLAYPFDYFRSIDDYQKPVNNLKKEEFFRKLKNKSPTDEKTERTKEIIKKYIIKNGEELKIYLASDK